MTSDARELTTHPSPTIRARLPPAHPDPVPVSSTSQAKKQARPNRTLLTNASRAAVRRLRQRLMLRGIRRALARWSSTAAYAAGAREFAARVPAMRKRRPAKVVFYAWRARAAFAAARERRAVTASTRFELARVRCERAAFARWRFVATATKAVSEAAVKAAKRATIEANAVAKAEAEVRAAAAKVEAERAAREAECATKIALAETRAEANAKVDEARAEANAKIAQARAEAAAKVDAERARVSSPPPSIVGTLVFGETFTRAFTADELAAAAAAGAVVAWTLSAAATLVFPTNPSSSPEMLRLRSAAETCEISREADAASRAADLDALTAEVQQWRAASDRCEAGKHAEVDARETAMDDALAHLAEEKRRAATCARSLERSRSIRVRLWPGGSGFEDEDADATTRAFSSESSFFSRSRRWFEALEEATPEAVLDVTRTVANAASPVIDAVAPYVPSTDATVTIPIDPSTAATALAAALALVTFCLARIVAAHRRRRRADAAALRDAREALNTREESSPRWRARVADLEMRLDSARRSKAEAVEQVKRQAKEDVAAATKVMKELTALAEKGEAAKAAFRDEAKKATAELDRANARAIAAEEAFARVTGDGTAERVERVERVSSAEANADADADAETSPSARGAPPRDPLTPVAIPPVAVEERVSPSSRSPPSFPRHTIFTAEDVETETTAAAAEEEHSSASLGTEKPAKKRYKTLFHRAMGWEMRSKSMRDVVRAAAAAANDEERGTEDNKVEENKVEENKVEENKVEENKVEENGRVDPSLAAELAALREWRDSCATLSERWPESGDPVAGEWPGVVFGAAEKDDDDAEADHRASAAEADHRASAAAPKRARLLEITLGDVLAAPPPASLGVARALRRIAIATGDGAESRRFAADASGFRDLRHASLTGFTDLDADALCRQLHRAGCALETLELTSCGVRGSGPGALWRLSSLRRLALAKNALTSLPADFGTRVPALTSLDVSGNPKLAEIPESIGDVATTLVELDASRAWIANPPERLGECASLERVDFSGNPISRFPSSYGNLARLERLDARACALRVVPSFLRRVGSIREVDLSGNKIDAAPSSLAASPKLERLDLRVNPIASLPAEFARLRERLGAKHAMWSPNVTIRAPIVTDADALRALRVAVPALAERWVEFADPASWRGVSTREDGRVVELDLSALPDEALRGRAPEEIGRLTALKTLRLRKNRLVELCPEIGALTELETLDASENALAEIPEEWRRCANARVVDVSKNRLTALPESGLPPKIERLDASGNKLGRVPRGFGSGSDAARLETLILRSNRLAEVPASLADAPRLATIDVSANALTALPDALGGAGRLRHLDARKNPLRGFPAAAAALRTRAGNQPWCVVLLDDVVDAANGVAECGKDAANGVAEGGKDASSFVAPSSSNGGVRTGDGASDVAALREWRARSAELRELWPEFVAPTEWEGVTFDDDGRVVSVRLDKLGLVGPFPVELCRLDALVDLDLECNDLRGAVPEALGRLESLRSLLLGGNAVESVPASIGRLTLLETLTLHENKLESVPLEIGTCASLRTLLLFSNALTALPDTVGRLRNLRALQLGRNRIEDAPASLAECASLEHLNLRRNRLTNVPEAWGDMRSLASLSLRGNRLESVPASLARCPELVALDLAQNPALAVVPSEVFNLNAREGFQLTLDEGAMPMSSVGLESPPRSPVVSPPAKGSRPAVIETLSPIRDAEEEAAAAEAKEAGSRPGSRLGSRAGSRAGSKAGSRAGSRLASPAKPTRGSTLSNGSPKAGSRLASPAKQPQSNGSPIGSPVVSPIAIGRGIGGTRAYGSPGSPASPSPDGRSRSPFGSPVRPLANPNDAAVLRRWRDASPALRRLWTDESHISTWKGVELNEDGHVTALRLPEFGIGGAVPASVGTLRHLVELDLAGNEIDAVPPELGLCASLQVLWLNGNTLTSVPAELGQLERLVELLLNGNNLKRVPHELGKLRNLQMLWLLDNELESIPESLGGLAALEVLQLGRNGIRSVPTQLGELANLKELHLLRNRIEELPASLGRLANLEWLDVRSNRLGTLPSELGQCANLVKLHCGRNLLREIPESLGKLQKLKELDMSRNAGPTLPEAWAKGGALEKGGCKIAR